MVKGNTLLVPIRILSHQQGLLLIVALIFVLILSSISLMLMQNASYAMKIVMARDEQIRANYVVQHIADEVIYNNQITTYNMFNKAANSSLNITELITSTDEKGVKVNTYNQAILSHVNLQSTAESKACPSLLPQSSEANVTCENFRLQVITKYGKNFQHTIEHYTGLIVQKIPLLDDNIDTELASLSTQLVIYRHYAYVKE